MMVQRHSPKVRTGRRSDHTLLWVRVLLVLGIVTIRLPTLSEPRWFSDEGIFTAVAQGVASGLPLYARVFDNSPPGIYLLFMGLIDLGAVQHHWVVGAAAAAAVACVSLFIFSLVRRLASTETAVLAAALCGIALSIPTLDGDLVNVELAALPFFTASLLVAFSRRRWAPLASGLLIGLAIVTRPSLAFDGLALLVPLVGIGGAPVRRVGLAAAGCAATLLVVAVGLWDRGSLAAYVGVVMPSDHAYVVWSNGGSLLPLYLRLLALAGAGAIWFRLSHTLPGRLLAVWLPAALAGSTITPRDYMHYAQEAIPVLSVAAALMATWVRPRWWVASAPVALLGVVIVAQFVLLVAARETQAVSSRAAQPPAYNFTFTQLPAYYRNWVLLVSGRESWPSYVSGFPADVQRQKEEIAILRRLSVDSEQPSLLVFGDEPWIYVESGLQPATRYVAINSASARVPTSGVETLSSVTSSCATFVVVTSNLAALAPALHSGGYREVSGAPWPTFVTGAADQDAACASRKGSETSANPAAMLASAPEWELITPSSTPSATRPTSRS
ncbi:MAG TPA: hypothetical protein VNG93_14885 [Candidatus Dormibacteraeota bacterium]|nr:hypothetical protein [Candidatus Dormibacteraeota bacterium]